MLVLLSLSLPPLAVWLVPVSEGQVCSKVNHAVKTVQTGLDITAHILNFIPPLDEKKTWPHVSTHYSSLSYSATSCSVQNIFKRKVEVSRWTYMSVDHKREILSKTKHYTHLFVINAEYFTHLFASRAEHFIHYFCLFPVNFTW